MKQFALSLGIVLAFCVPDALAQRINLVGTTWVLKYTTGKVNSNDYGEYAKISFERGGKALFENGETARWTLKGNRLTVENDSSHTVSVRYVEVRIKGAAGTGTAVLGMTTTVPYWVRLIKEMQAPSTQRRQVALLQGASVTAEDSWNSFWSTLQTAVRTRDRRTMKAMMLNNFAWTFQEYFQGERREAFFKNLDNDKGSGWRTLNKIIATGTIVDAKSTPLRPARITPPPDCGGCEDCQAYFEFRNERWLWISFYGCGDFWRDHWAVR